MVVSLIDGFRILNFGLYKNASAYFRMKRNRNINCIKVFCEYHLETIAEQR